MAAHVPVIGDRVGSVLAGRTLTELIKPEGKEKLKQGLLEKLNAASHGEEKVVSIYRPTFIVQQPNRSLARSAGTRVLHGSGVPAIRIPGTPRPCTFRL